MCSIQNKLKNVYYYDGYLWTQVKAEDKTTLINKNSNLKNFIAVDITKNKIYKIIHIMNRNSKKIYYICSDNTTNVWLPDELFIPLGEYRRNILNTIIDEKY